MNAYETAKEILDDLDPANQEGQAELATAYALIAIVESIDYHASAMNKLRVTIETATKRLVQS